MYAHWSPKVKDCNPIRDKPRCDSTMHHMLTTPVRGQSSTCSSYGVFWSLCFTPSLDVSPARLRFHLWSVWQLSCEMVDVWSLLKDLLLSCLEAVCVNKAAVIFTCQLQFVLTGVWILGGLWRQGYSEASPAQVTELIPHNDRCNTH